MRYASKRVSLPTGRLPSRTRHSLGVNCPTPATALQLSEFRPLHTFVVPFHPPQIPTHRAAFPLPASPSRTTTASRTRALTSAPSSDAGHRLVTDTAAPRDTGAPRPVSSRTKPKRAKKDHGFRRHPPSRLGLARRPGHPQRGGAPRRHPLRPRLGPGLHAPGRGALQDCRQGQELCRRVRLRH